MDKVYIFGSDKFCKATKRLLNGINITNYETISDVVAFKDIIEHNPDQFYLIDNEKIYKPNIITKYIKFLIPKNGIESSFLDIYNLGALEFSTTKKAIDYIKLRIEDHSEPTEELESKDEIVEETNQDDDPFDEFSFEHETIEEEIEEKDRDLTQITNIEDIEDYEMDSAICDLDLKKDK